MEPILLFTFGVVVGMLVSIAAIGALALITSNRKKDSQ